MCVKSWKAAPMPWRRKAADRNITLNYSWTPTQDHAPCLVPDFYQLSLRNPSCRLKKGILPLQITRDSCEIVNVSYCIISGMQKWRPLYCCWFQAPDICKCLVVSLFVKVVVSKNRLLLLAVNRFHCLKIITRCSRVNKIIEKHCKIGKIMI